MDNIKRLILKKIPEAVVAKIYENPSGLKVVHISVPVVYKSKRLEYTRDEGIIGVVDKKRIYLKAAYWAKYSPMLQQIVDSCGYPASLSMCHTLFATDLDEDEE